MSTAEFVESLSWEQQWMGFVIDSIALRKQMRSANGKMAVDDTILRLLEFHAYRYRN